MIPGYFDYRVFIIIFYLLHNLMSTIIVEACVPPKNALYVLISSIITCVVSGIMLYYIMAFAVPVIAYRPLLVLCVLLLYAVLMQQLWCAIVFASVRLRILLMGTTAVTVLLAYGASSIFVWYMSLIESVS